MEDKLNFIRPLLDSAEEYGKTSFKLIKVKALYKSADAASTVISRLILIVVFLLFTTTLSIAIALYLGDVLGKSYYGFLLVASFYALLAIIIFFIHPFIKAIINNSIITQLFN